MLIIARRKDERVILTTPEGTRVVLTLMGLDRARALLAFDAPRSIRIERADPESPGDPGARTGVPGRQLVAPRD